MPAAGSDFTTDAPYRPRILLAASVFGMLTKRIGSMALASSTTPMPTAVKAASTFPSGTARTPSLRFDTRTCWTSGRLQAAGFHHGILPGLIDRVPAVIPGKPFTLQIADLLHV